MSALVVVLVLLVLAAGIYAGYRANQRHKAALAQFAAGHGFTYAEQDDSYAERWNHPPFGIGHSRHASNVMTGRHGDRDVAVFDYRYSETHTDAQGHTSESTYRYAIYAVYLPCALPTLVVSPEGFFTKVGHAMGMHDIELESEDFNRRFRVTADDPKLAYDLLPARTMALLLEHDDVHLRVDGSTVLCVDRQWLHPERIEPRLDVICQLLANVPAFVWEDHPPGAASGV